MRTMPARPAGRRRPPLPPAAAALWLVAAATLVVFGLAVEPALRLPGHVDHVVIENPHPWSVTVEAREAAGGGWTPVATVPRDDAVRADEVLDHGDRWELRFRYAGHDGGRVVVDRSAHEAAGWRMTVPDATADRLRDAGASPSAP